MPEGVLQFHEGAARRGGRFEIDSQLEGTMDQSSRFWDKIAERYSKRPVANEAAYQKKLQITHDYLQPEMEVLELGLRSRVDRHHPCALCESHSRN